MAIVRVPLLFFFIQTALSLPVFCQYSETGAWYIYFGNARFKNSPLSLHIEAQYRNHNIIGDLEQLLLRGGLQYNLKDNAATFTAGYGFIRSEPEGSDNTAFTTEHRLYNEALLRQGIGRVRLMHRFRYEWRFITDQIFRTRFRYAVFVNTPLNQKSMAKNALYLALYNEVFINGQKLDNGPIFDRNRAYAALGYMLTDRIGIQAGYMVQSLENSSKGQLQLSLHHNFFL